MTPVAAALAAELAVCIAIAIGASIIVNGHVLWAYLVGIAS